MDWLFTRVQPLDGAKLYHGLQFSFGCKEVPFLVDWILAMLGCIATILDTSYQDVSPE